MKELLLLAIVAYGSDKSGEQHSETDCDAIEPMVRLATKEAYKKLQRCKHQEQLGHPVLKLLKKKVSVAIDGGQTSLVFSEAKFT